MFVCLQEGATAADLARDAGYDIMANEYVCLFVCRRVQLQQTWQEMQGMISSQNSLNNPANLQHFKLQYKHSTLAQTSIVFTYQWIQTVDTNRTLPTWESRPTPVPVLHASDVTQLAHHVSIECCTHDHLSLVFGSTPWTTAGLCLLENRELRQSLFYSTFLTISHNNNLKALCQCWMYSYKFCIYKYLTEA